MSTPRPIIVIAEQFNGEIRKSSLQATGKARECAGSLGVSFRVIAFGRDKNKVAEQLAHIGVTEFSFVPLSDTSDRNAEAIAPMLKEAIGGGAATVFLGNSDMAADVAPRLAALLGAALVADCTGVEVANGTLQFLRPIYAGKALEKVEILSESAVVTVRANAFPIPGATDGGSAQVVELSTATPADLKALVKEIVARSGLDQVSLTEADIIVSGGIGIGGPEGYEPLRKLCKVLGAALGASRAAVHAGWIGQEFQVGQTGKTVSPNLYIACGISGAIQHQAGMRTSRCIVAINTDPAAPIFTIAHYGIVGDVHQIVPALTEEFQKVLGSA